MVCYFASRSMWIIALASTELFTSGQRGLHIKDDKKIEDISVGQDIFSGYLCYGPDQRLRAEQAAEVGNYILRKNERDNKDEFYTIIDTEANPINGEIYFYAESAGLDLIGEICNPFTADGKHTLVYYINKWIADTGFEIGINQVSDQKKALAWDDSETAAERINSTASSFGCEVSYRFVIDGFVVRHKYLDFCIRRGSQTHKSLRRGRDFEEISIKKSLAEIATSLRVTGGVPDGSGVRRNSDETYTWVRFSDTWDGKDGEGGANMSDDSTDMYYVGIAAGKTTEEESEDPDDYVWGPIRKGSLLVITPSAVGHRQWKNISGKARYAWIMFATDEEGSNMSDNPTDRSYVGYAINQTSSEKSTLPEDYTWIPMDGRDAHRDIFINPGTGGISEGGGLYTWIKYADDEKGGGMSNSPVGKNYVGIAFHKASATESSNAASYAWCEITLNTKDGGFVMAKPHYPGIRQSDGKFIWVKFAKTATGKSVASGPTERPYIGIAYDKTGSIPDFNAVSYEWALLGEDDSKKVTLTGLAYDDGDIYVDRATGQIYSREALSKYTRYLSPNETGTGNGHIVADFESEATTPQDLLQEAIAELRRRCVPETTYEVEVPVIPKDIRIGDTIGIADPEGELYLNARIIKIETSSERDTCAITLGNYSAAKKGINDQIAKLAKAQRAAPNTSKYQWVIYADSPSGDGMRLNPEDAQWMGVASNKASPEPNLTDPYLYEWTRIVGDDGEEGIKGEKGEDAVTLRVDSTRGIVFKNNWYDTQLRVTVIKGSRIITDATHLHSEFGAGAYLQWSWRKQADQEWSPMSINDSHITEGGFCLNVTPQDVDEQITFQCDLIG